MLWCSVHVIQLKYEKKKWNEMWVCIVIVIA